MERELVQVNIAVLAVADAPTSAGDAIGKLIVDRLTEAGHRVIARETVKDSVQRIRAHFLNWIADPDIDVVLVTKGLDTVATTDALEPLVTRPLAGFRDLFRMLSYEEIGTAAMLIDVDAAQCGSTYVFVLPSSNGAVRTALDRLLLPQLDHRTKPHNLVMRMPRLRNELARLGTDGPNAPPVRPTPEPGAPARPTAGAPTQKLALPWITPAPPAIPAVVKQEITAVGPPPPPPPRKRPTTNNPVPPQDGPIGSIARPAAPAEPASTAPPEPPAKPSEPERVPTLGELATPIEPSAGSVKPTNLETLSRIIDSASTNTTTGTIITSSELPVFSGEDFTHRTPRTSNRKLLLVFCGLALVAAASLGAMAMIGERAKAAPGHRDPRVAVVKPPAMPELPPSAPTLPPPPEPTPELPEIELAETPTAKPEEPRAKPVAVRRRPPGPTVPTPVVGGELTPPADDGCDEVECILQSYKRACCQRYKPADPDVRPSSGLPEVLDRSMIAAGVATMKPVVIRCGEKSGVKGTVKLAVEVAANGRVQEVSVASTPDAALGDCVAAAMRKVTFGRTETGGTFQYPYVF